MCRDGKFPEILNRGKKQGRNKKGKKWTHVKKLNFQQKS
jgi:hypothetical protein